MSRTREERQCEAWTRDGNRCRNYIDVAVHPHEKYCHVHREGFDVSTEMPDSVAQAIATAIGATSAHVVQVYKQFNNTIRHLTKVKNDRYREQGRRKRISDEEVESALCCDPQEFRMVVKMFKNLARAMEEYSPVNPLVRLHIGFLIFYAIMKFDHGAIDVTVRTVSRWVRRQISDADFTDLYMRYGTQRAIIAPLLDVRI
jgi:hypothetical protein